jgi:hypothetical protein
LELRKHFLKSNLPARDKPMLSERIPTRDAETSSISGSQINELKRIRDMDYTLMPVQGGPRSLFFLSVIATHFSMNVIVPPTIFLGFKDNTRFMWNDPRTGRILIRNDYISPDDVS